MFLTGSPDLLKLGLFNKKKLFRNFDFQLLTTLCQWSRLIKKIIIENTRLILDWQMTNGYDEHSSID